ncbi:MAG: SPOR domain-containing protein, partial [Desulfovibrionales bacterium]
FIPQLAKILPQDAVQSIQGPAPKDERSETLKPEDLTFYDDLKKGSEPKREPVKKTPVKASPPKPVAQPPVKPASPAPAAASAETGRFRYIYQVAAFKEEDRAVLFRDQILKGGISSYFLKGESAGDPWFRVYVSFDGTPEQTGKLHSELEKMGVKNPLLRSKKPI